MNCYLYLKRDNYLYRIASVIFLKDIVEAINKFNETHKLSFTYHAPHYNTYTWESSYTTTFTGEQYDEDESLPSEELSYPVGQQNTDVLIKLRAYAYKAEKCRPVVSGIIYDNVEKEEDIRILDIE